MASQKRTRRNECNLTEVLMDIQRLLKVLSEILSEKYGAEIVPKEK